MKSFDDWLDGFNDKPSSTNNKTTTMLTDLDYMFSTAAFYRDRVVIKLCKEFNREQLLLALVSSIGTVVNITIKGGYKKGGLVTDAQFISTTNEIHLFFV